MLVNYVFTLDAVFLQDSWQSSYGPGGLTMCQCYLRTHAVDEGPGTTL